MPCQRRHGCCCWRRTRPATRCWCGGPRGGSGSVPILPFAITGSRELLETLPRHETAPAALLIDILDVLRGISSPPRENRAPLARQLSPSELRVLRYLPTNLSRPEIAGELSVSVNTVNTHVRRIYAKLGADDRSAAVHHARKLQLLSAGCKH
jgi:LuxR family maltose regulon positive regulatory protein